MPEVFTHSSSPVMGSDERTATTDPEADLYLQVHRVRQQNLPSYTDSSSATSTSSELSLVD